MENLWGNILLEIEKQISKPVFLTFFKPSRLISYDSKTAVIGAPTDIGAEYIEKKFQSLIEKVFYKNTGKNVQLVFIKLEDNAN